MSIAQARLESIKSGLMSAGVVGFVATMVMLLALAVNLPSVLPPSVIPKSLTEGLVNVAVAITSGFFFGVTYRYIVRRDDNLHLGGGAVGAFAFVRSLAQIEAIWDDTFALLSWIVITGESFLWFVTARYTLDWALSRQLIQPTD